MHVGNMDGLAFEHGSAVHGAAARCDRMCFMNSINSGGYP